MFDRRWQVALDLPLDYSGFDPSSLSNFRKRLVEHGQERYAFDRFVAIGRAAGFIPDSVTALVDTTWTKGAGAVQDTYTLVRKGIRKLLRDMGYATPGKRRGLSAPAQALVASYLDRDHKADIDWADPQQRATQLKVLVQDAESALELADVCSDDPDVRATGWLLTKILGDDIVEDDQGDPQIGKGTATERIISVTDPDMRHGRKSKAQRFNGYKVAVATEPSSDMILDIANVPASGSDGAHLLPAIQRIEEHAAVTVERVIGDGAYTSGENLAACANYPAHPVDLLTPVARPKDGTVDKSAFQIDLQAGLANLSAWAYRRRAAHLTGVPPSGPAIHLPARGLRGLPRVCLLRAQQVRWTNGANRSLRVLLASPAKTTKPARVQSRVPNPQSRRAQAGRTRPTRHPPYPLSGRRQTPTPTLVDGRRRQLEMPVSPRRDQER